MSRKKVSINEYNNIVVASSEVETKSILKTSLANGNSSISSNLELIVSQVKNLEKQLETLTLNTKNKSNTVSDSGNSLLKAYFKKWLKEKYIYRNELTPSTTIYENSIITEFNKELDELKVSEKVNDEEVKDYILQVFDKTQRIKSKSKDDDKNYYYKNLDLR